MIVPTWVREGQRLSEDCSWKSQCSIRGGTEAIEHGMDGTRTVEGRHGSSLPRVGMLLREGSSSSRRTTSISSSPKLQRYCGSQAGGSGLTRQKRRSRKGVARGSPGISLRLRLSTTRSTAIWLISQYLLRTAALETRRDTAAQPESIHCSNFRTLHRGGNTPMHLP